MIRFSESGSQDLSNGTHVAFQHASFSSVFTSVVYGSGWFRWCFKNFRFCRSNGDFTNTGVSWMNLNCSLLHKCNNEKRTRGDIKLRFYELLLCTDTRTNQRQLARESLAGSEEFLFLSAFAQVTDNLTSRLPVPILRNKSPGRGSRSTWCPDR
jgi:hypothetical protein